MIRRALVIVLAITFGALAVWWIADGGKGGGVTTSAPAARSDASADRSDASAWSNARRSGWPVREWTTAWGSMSRGPNEGGDQAIPRSSEAEVEEVVRAIFIAYNARKLEPFLEGWTERGFVQAFDVPKASAPALFFIDGDLGPTSYRVGGFAQTRVDGTTARTEVELVQDQVRQGYQLSLLKTDETWRIDGSEKIPGWVPRGIPVIDVKAKWYSFEFDPSRIRPGTLAFRLTNADGRAHELLVMRRRSETGQEELVGHVGPVEPGGRATLTLTDLEPGQYVMLCNMVDVMKLPYSHGMRKEFTVN